jgi:hypothetical protein
MRNGLTDQARTDFFTDALHLAREAGAVAIVVIADTEKKLASQESSSHEEDVTMMFLERTHSELAEGKQALVIFDRQGGSQSRDTHFLRACVALSRLIQLADVVTSYSTSYISGEDRHSPEVFSEGVLPLLSEKFGRRGGCGLKIHPDYRYGNLYHWLLGDSDFVKAMAGTPLPSNGFTCYRESAAVA